MGSFTKPAENHLEWPFDPSSAMRVDDGDGLITPRSVDYEDQQEDRGGPDATGVYRYFTIVYEVPGDLTTVQFEVDLPDSMHETDLDVWLFATSGGGTQRYSVSFDA